VGWWFGPWRQFLADVTNIDSTSEEAGLMTKRVSLWEIARMFFIIGITGFGGGLAIIALIQDYCVNRKKWLSLEEFSHGVAFGQILSAFAVNCTLFVGYRLRGVKGALVAASAFLAPSVSIVIILSWLYFRYHRVPSLQSALHGVSPVVVALIVSAAWSMSKGRMKSAEPILLALAAAGLMMIFPKIPIILVLFAAVVYGLTKLQFTKGAVNEKA